MVNYDAFKGKERPLPCMATSCFSPPLLESGGLEEGEREQDLTVRQKAICFFSPSCLALTPARGVRAVASSKHLRSLSTSSSFPFTGKLGAGPGNEGSLGSDPARGELILKSGWGLNFRGEGPLSRTCNCRKKRVVTGEV